MSWLKPFALSVAGQLDGEQVLELQAACSTDEGRAGITRVLLEAANRRAEQLFQTQVRSKS
jgi:hypothetical protein